MVVFIEFYSRVYYWTTENVWETKTEQERKEGNVRIIRPSESFELLYNQSIEVNKLEANSKPQRVLVLSSVGRSGSSFLGLILASLENNMYFFEPIRGLPEDSRDKVNSTEEVINYFQCNIRKSFLEVGPMVDISVKHPYTLNKTIKQVTLEALIEHCLQEPLIIVKVIRARLKWIRERMEQKELNNLKVIHLVRDPRGSFTSMETLKWKKTDTELCADIHQDLEEKKTMMSLYPNRYTFIKYEDLCRNPYGETRRLLHFIRGHGEEKHTMRKITQTVDNIETRLDPAVYQDLPKSILDFISNHMHLNPNKTATSYSVERNTVLMDQWWRWTINGSQLSRIETSCSNVIRALNHRMFFKLSSVRNPSISLSDDKPS